MLTIGAQLVQVSEPLSGSVSELGVQFFGFLFKSQNLSLVQVSELGVQFFWIFDIYSMGICVNRVFAPTIHPYVALHELPQPLKLQDCHKAALSSGSKLLFIFFVQC